MFSLLSRLKKKVHLHLGTLFSTEAVTHQISFRAAFHSILNSMRQILSHWHAEYINSLKKLWIASLHFRWSRILFPVSLQQEHVGCFYIFVFFRWRTNFIIHIQKCINNTRGQQNRRANICDRKNGSNEIKNLIEVERTRMIKQKQEKLVWG